MKTVKHLCIVYSAPVVLILLVLQILLSPDKVSQGDILILSLVPIFMCAYFWMLITNSPYNWLNDFYVKNQEKIESSFSLFSKISLILFPVIYFSADSILLQNGYHRQEINRKTHLDGSHYYKKSDQLLLRPGKGKLKCVETEKSGETVMICYEVY